jgi:hypothetical protein
MTNFRLVDEFIGEAKSNGFSSALQRAAGHIRYKFRSMLRESGIKMTLDEAIIMRRQEIAKRVGDIIGERVAYGPFKGLLLSNNRWWGIDRASMLLGLYEKEILDAFDALPPSHRTFVDLGAADGYYAVGALVSGKFDYCYCYEASKKARDRLLQNAKLNNVSDRIKISSTAEPRFWEELKQSGVDLSKVVMICDIEGGEFDLFDEQTFEAFSGAVIFMELHEFMLRDGEQALSRLKRAAGKYFKVTEFVSGARDPSKFPELRSFSDDDRWLICSEGRGELMRWLRLDRI